MKFIRVLLRLALLSLAATALVELTALYGSSDRPSVASDPVWQEGRDHRPSAPQLGYFSEFVGEGLLLVFFAAAGRIVFRLRLNPPPRGEGKTILLDLHRRQNSLNASPPPIAPTPPGR